MNLSTTNPGGKARRITRVTNKELWIGYHGFYQPMLAFDVTGQDGIKYSIELNDYDIQKINEARAKYAEHFDEKR